MVHPAGTGKQRGTAAGQAHPALSSAGRATCDGRTAEQRLALLGCELTLLFHDAKTGKAASIWGRPT